MWKNLLRGPALNVHVFHLENTLLLIKINKKMFHIIYGRREYAKKHLGQTGHPNASQLDLANFYPAMMHQATRATETIVRRIGQVADALKQNKKQWFLEVQKVARKVCLSSYDVTFDENGVLAFYEKAEELLNNSGFSPLVNKILVCFCTGLKKIFQWILHTPKELTRQEYECQARVLLGFQFILIFGSQTVTATVKELVAYTGFYVEKALKDAALSGLPLTLRNFNDSIMETKHKEAKQGNYIYSSGRVGETGKIDYQKRVLTQQFCHEWASVENREKKGCSYSSDSKVHKKENEDLPKHLKKKKMV